MMTVPTPSRTSVLLTIALLLRDGEASLPQTARRLELSSRSLQRRLSDIGTSFGELIAEVRLETACRLIAQSDLSLAAIAHRLGYARPSGFSRSFMRSMKMQPAVYRKQQIAALRKPHSGTGRRRTAKAEAAHSLARNDKTDTPHLLPVTGSETDIESQFDDLA